MQCLRLRSSYDVIRQFLGLYMFIQDILSKLSIFFMLACASYSLLPTLGSSYGKNSAKCDIDVSKTKLYSGCIISLYFGISLDNCT